VARYFAPPDGYQPGLVFHLRERQEGGGLRSDVRQEPLRDPFTRSEVIVLVHGFNNHYGEASVAYHGFRLRQYEHGGPQFIPPALEGLLADLFWPGDAGWWGLFDRGDFLVYPAAVSTARDAAPRLARHLRSMPTLRTVHFIAHSLGCRIVLETIDDLRQHGGPTVGKVCLMAAAVPVFEVQSGGNLSAAMEYAKEMRILYSDDDAVLRYAFPPGQTLASGSEGRFPTALGLHGPPPGVAGQIDSIDINDAGHSDYWGHSQKKLASDAATKSIADFFRFGLWKRTLTARAPGRAPRTGTAEPRELGYVRAIR